jgi:DNA mismatch repair protein MutS
MKRLEPWQFDPQAAKRDLAKQFGTADLSGFGCDGMEAAVAAAGALISYCSHTQQSTLPHVTGLRVERESEFVAMDAATRRNLEITETLAGAESPTLFSLLDRCATSMGSRRLRHWLHHPLRDTKELGCAARGDRLARPLDLAACAIRAVAQLFAPWSDVERITARIALRTARPRDLAGLRDTLATLPQLHPRAHRERRSGPGSAARDRGAGRGAARAPRGQRSRTSPLPVIREGGVIRDGFDRELDELRAIQDHSGEFLLGDGEARARAYRHRQPARRVQPRALASTSRSRRASSTRCRWSTSAARR